MNIKTDNLFASIPDSIEEELFTELALGKNIKIERIVSKGHSSPKIGWHDQTENEWVMLVQGEAILQFINGEDIHLKAGSHLTIPANTKHKVTWTPPNTETIWLAVHYQ